MGGISAALKASGCTTEEEQAAAKQFITDDIQDPSDLGDDEAKAGARIDDILAKANLGTDARAKIKKAMLDALSKEKEDPPPADPPKVPSSTSIQAVLKGIQGITEEERAKTLAEFDKQGIIELVDLGKDTQSADAKIDEVLGKTGLSKDKIDLCKNALKAARTKDKEKQGDAQPAESTSVPPGGANVQSPTFPTLKAEIAGTITTFKIPEIFTSNIDPTHPYQSPDELKPWQWIHLARTNNLTKALDLNLMLAGSEDPWAKYSAFLWELQEGAVDDISKGTAESTVSASIEEDRISSNMVVNASIAGQYALCSASVKASYAMQTNEDRYSKRIYTRARWRQPRCSLIMANCLTVAPILQHLINVAFDDKLIEPKDRFDFLTQLFDLFGHLIPARVYLGGMLEICQELVSVESQSREATKTSLDSAVSLKSQNLPASGQLQVGFATDGSGLKVQANCIENLAFTAIGGEPTLLEPAKWLPTTNTPEHWKTIGRDGTMPISQMLKQEDQDAIDGVIAEKAREAWTDDAVVELATADGGDFTLPLKQDKNGRVLYSQQQPILPYFPKGHRVTLKNWWSSEIGDGDYLQALNTEQRTPDSTAQNEDGQGVDGVSLPPGDPCRVQGTYYTYCQPAPACAPDAAGASPKEEHLLWTFVYTGRMIRDGTRPFEEPLF